MPGNVVDVTAIALPLGTYDDGMPRSLQLWGPPGSEEIVLDAGEAISSARV
jgi:Asp-tRNA(Asn)/Glu-tRNA(Gln) amidotransferase A subunit family amidase